MGVTISKNKKPGGTLTPGPLTHQHEAHGLQGPIAKINHTKAMSATNNCNNDDSAPPDPEEEGYGPDDVEPYNPDGPRYLDAKYPENPID